MRTNNTQPQPRKTIRRRRYLLGIAGLTALSGCAGDDIEDSESSSGGQMERAVVQTN